MRERLKSIIFWNEYGLVLYIFIMLTGVAVFVYFINAAKAVTNIILVLEPLRSNPDLVRYVLILGPLAAVLALAVPRRKYGVQMLRYVAFVSNLATMLGFVSVPLGGIAMINVNNMGRSLTLGVDPRYVPLIVAGLAVAFLSGSVQSALPWIIVRLAVKDETGRVVEVIDNLRKNEVINLAEGRGLMVTILSSPEVARSVSLVAEPKDAWKVTKSDAGSRVGYDLTPLRDTEGVISIVHSKRVLRNIRVKAKTMLKFARLALEFVLGGKTIRIVEIDHLVGRPLKDAILRIASLIPGIPSDLRNLTAHLVGKEGFKSIPLTFKDFKSGHTYHIVVQVGRAVVPVAPQAPQVLTREWKAKPEPLKEVTAEWHAKPPAKVNVDKHPTIETVPSKHVERIVGSVVELIEEARKLGEDLW